MKLNQAKSFMDAVQASNITNFSFFDDIQTRYNNDGERSFVVLNESDETLWSFRKTLHQETPNGILVAGNNIEDIRRAQVISDYKGIKKFVDNYGLTLTSDQLKILLILDNTNNEVMPITGDYHNIFHVISDEAYAALSPEEKAEYDRHIEEEKKRYNLPKGSAAQITC